MIRNFETEFEIDETFKAEYEVNVTMYNLGI